MVSNNSVSLNYSSASSPHVSSDLGSVVSSINTKSNKANAIYGTAHADLIEVSMGDSKIFAYDGDNVILTGKGNDSIYAGAGRDIIEADDGNNIIFAGEGVNLITAGSGDNLIIAGSSGDFINARNGDNVVLANGGNNRVLTGNGSDVIVTDAGNSVIYSGSGDDVVTVGNGNNVINAGTGRDIINLGSGANKIILEAGDGDVTVNGFNIADDKLRLGESLLGKSLNFVSQGEDTLVMAGDDRLATLKGVASGSPALLDNAPLYRYQATDLGSLSSDPNGAVNAASINDFGQIAGRYDTGTTFTNQNAITGATQIVNTRQGFVWENGTQTALTSTGVKNGESDFGAADGAIVTLLTPNINTIGNRGLILGTADEVRQPMPKATDRALIWQKDGGYKLSINDFGGIESYFFDTNNRNQIPGRNIDSADPEHETPFYWEEGVKTVLADLVGNGGTARGINGKGDIVGYVDGDGKVDDKVVNTAILWTQDANGNYQLTNLGSFGAEQATLRDINNAGQIIGATANGSGTAATSTPFLLRDAFTTLGSLGGKTGSTNGINEFGEVVGASQIASGANHAYAWVGGVMTDLNSLVSTPITYKGSVVTLTSAVAINNFGDIVATGTYFYKDDGGVDKTGTRSYLLKAV